MRRAVLLVAVAAIAIALLARTDDDRAAPSPSAEATTTVPRMRSATAPRPALPSPTALPAEIAPPVAPVVSAVERAKQGEQAPPQVTAALEDVRLHLRQSARGCAGAAGHTFEVHVDVVVEGGEAHVRSAAITRGALGTEIDRCVEGTLAAQRWPLASPDQRLAVRIPLAL